MEAGRAGTPGPLRIAQHGDSAKAGVAAQADGPKTELCTSRESLLARTVAHLGLPDVDCDDLVGSWNARPSMVERLVGGQARVYICPWVNSAPPSSSGSPPLIPDGQLIAFKHMLLPNGGGNFPTLKTEEDFKQAARHGQRALSLELNLMDAIHRNGCGARLVKPLGIVGWPGWFLPEGESRRGFWWEPTYGYVMPAYPRGSVTKLLADICHRALPADAGQRFLNLHTLSAEYGTLLGELHGMHTTPGLRLQLQDLTPNNLLVDDSSQGMRLLFADPAMALPISVLQRPKPRPGHILGTWLWGSMKARSGRFDPTADLYSLSFVFAEMWLVAEGAAAPVFELIQETRLDADKAQGVRFVRSLVVQVLRSHLNRGSIVPRVKRHLPVSWLGAWALLLGFRDHQNAEQMRLGLPCLRPSEEEMLELAQLWARVCGAAEDLPQDMTEEQAQSPACQPLVGDMCRLLARLLQLSQLEAAPEDPDLKWLAANFMALKHPLVAGMKAQGAVGGGNPEGPSKARGWSQAVHRAQAECEYAATSEEFTRALIRIRAEREWERGTLAAVWSWYQGMAAQLQPSQLMPEAVAGPLRQAAGAAGVQVVWPLPSASGSNSQAPTPAAAAAAAAAEQGEEQHGNIEGSPVLQGWPSLLQEAEQQAQHLLSVQQGLAAAGQKRKAAEGGCKLSIAAGTAAAVAAVGQAVVGLLGDSIAMIEACKQAAMHTADAADASASRREPPAVLPTVEALLHGSASAHSELAASPPKPAGPAPTFFKTAPAGLPRALPGATSGGTSGNLTATTFRPRHTPASDAVTPPAIAAAFEASSPSTKRPRRSRYSTAPLAAGAASPAPAGPTAGSSAGVPANGAGPDGIYPWPNAAMARVAGEQGGERWESWLERIQPRLVAGICEAVVPGSGQLDLFKAITSLELADRFLAAWAGPAGSNVAGLSISKESKGSFNDAVLERCGLRFEQLYAGRTGTYGQKLLRAMGPGILPAVRAQVQAMQATMAAGRADQ